MRSGRAKGAFDPNNALRAVGRPFQGDHVEAHLMAAPICPPLQEKLSGANDFSLFLPGNGGERSAEIDPAALPHFDDGQHIAIEAYEIEFPGSAPEVACEKREAEGLEILRRPLLGGGTALQAGIGGREDLGRHEREGAAFTRSCHRGYRVRSQCYDGVIEAEV
jgi:hypothetical protein